MIRTWRSWPRCRHGRRWSDGQYETAEERKRRKRRQLRLSFAEPSSVADFVKCYGSEDAFTERGEAKPTDALPGSNEKIEVLCKRVAAGLPLWHDQDRKFFWKMNSVWNAAPWTGDDEV